MAPNAKGLAHTDLTSDLCSIKVPPVRVEQGQCWSDEGGVGLVSRLQVHSQ